MAKRFSTPIELRFSDLDAYGHVNSAVYFTYLETARMKLFREVFQELTDQGLFIVVGRAECDFRSPILLNDHVMVSVWVARVGNTSFDLEYHIHDSVDKTYATARTTMVCFDSVNEKPISVPDRLRELA